MHPQEKFSILLVDDDAMVVRVMALILANFTPLRFATSGRAALKLAQDSLPDLVLLDVEMPEFSGFDVCKAFKSTPTLADVPIIFVTSHESAQLQAKGLELGAADFITKPMHAPLLLARVRTYQRLKTLSETMRGAVKMDFLTGTVTRREFEKAVTQEWIRSGRSAAPLTLLIADIEGFSAYNAEFGEEKGDECLRLVAEALRSAARRSPDLLARYAGGQFALLLPETGVSGARTIADRAIESVAALQLLHARSSGRDRVTLCVGGGYRDSAQGTGVNASSDAVPDDLRLAAERGLEIARSAEDNAARFVDVAHVPAPQVENGRG